MSDDPRKTWPDTPAGWAGRWTAEIAAAQKEVEKWHLDGIDDYDAVYATFKNSPAVKAALEAAAKAAIGLGQEVPGTRRHFGLI